MYGGRNTAGRGEDGSRIPLGWTIRNMNKLQRDQLRRQLERIERLRITPIERRFSPVRVTTTDGPRLARRPIRPVRPWERLVRI